MIKPAMLASWGLVVAFFHGWAAALFWGWGVYKCGALFACAAAWLLAGIVLTVIWTDRQKELRERREAEEKREARR